MKKTNKQKNHLVQRGAMWYVSWDIPERVRQAFGNKKIMKKALSTNKMEATTLSHSLLHQWKSLAARVRNGEYDPEAAIKQKLLELKTEFKSSEESSAIKAIRNADDIKALFATPEQCIKLLDAWKSIQRDFSEPIYGTYQFAITGALQDIVDFISEHCETEISTADAYKYTELINIFKSELHLAGVHINTKTELSHEEVRVLSRRLRVPENEGFRHGLSNSALNSWKSSMADQHSKEKTVSGYFSKVKRFQKYLNDNNLDFDFAAVRDFKNSLSSMRETQSSYVGAIRKFRQWAILNLPAFAKIHGGSIDPTNHQQYPKHGIHAGESYLAYKSDEMQQLFNTCLTQRRPDLELACLIAYGAYTGARLEEIGAINKQNTLYELGEPIGFKIDISKSKAGIREVPIHPNLLPLHKVLLKAKCAEHSIFNARKTKQGAQISYLGARFSRLKTSLGYTKRHSFHSFRGTLITALYEHGAAETLIQHIVGHKGNSITSTVYLAGYSLAKKAEAIRLVNMPLDISTLLTLLESKK